MKKIFLFAALFFAASLISCSKEEAASTDIFPENGLITMTRDLDIPGTRAGTATLTAVFDLNTETLVNYAISQNVLDYIGIGAEELDQYLKDEMGAMYYLQSEPVTREHNHSTCIEGCKDKYEKGEGRGACKGSCWVETVRTILVAAADAAKDALNFP